MATRKNRRFRPNLFFGLLSALGVSANAQTIGFTDGFEITNWERTEILATDQVVSDGITNMAEIAIDGVAQSAEFTYDVGLPSGGVTNRTADFTITLANNAEITFDWQFTGMHAYFRAFAEFRIIVNGEVVESPVDRTSTFGDYSFSGFDQKVTVQAGDTFGFRIGGENYDSTSTLKGILTVSNFRVVDGGAGAKPLEIISVSTEVEVGGQTQTVIVTWNSKEGRTYSILASDDLSLGNLDLWEELDDGFAAAAGETTTSFTEVGVPIETKKRFYVVLIP